MTIDEKVEIVKKLVRENGNRFITLDFVKKDGSVRHMQCHRSRVLEESVKGTQPGVTAARRETLKKHNMICVEELVKPGTSEYQWRTVNCETVKNITAGKQKYIFD